MTQTRKLTIDIWSDVMCPWCLVGWGNLRQALDQLEGEIEADLRWHAFELNPDMAPEGEERTAHIARKYGRTLEQSKDVQGQMRNAAQSAGVSLDYEGEEPAPEAMMWNTFAADMGGRSAWLRSADRAQARAVRRAFQPAPPDRRARGAARYRC